MGGPKYERISSGEDERAPAWTTKRAVVALAACSAFAAYTAPHATKVAAVQSLYKVGHALETSAAATDGTLLAADVAAVEDCAACECDELESLGVLAADAGGATESPTAMDYWELFWTDGEFGSELDDSYVWWTNEELEGVRANVLVDTFGDSRGIDIDSNSTSIFFTVDGCIGRVEPDGLDLKEVFCYDVDDDPGSQMEGLALYEYDNKMYWVDKKRNTLYGAELEGNDGDYWVVSEGFDEPIDVAVDERAAALYVVDNTGIYKMDQDGSDLTLVLSEADAGLASFGGLDVDATSSWPGSAAEPVPPFFTDDELRWAVAAVCFDAGSTVSLPSALSLAVMRMDFLLSVGANVRSRVSTSSTSCLRWRRRTLASSA